MLLLLLAADTADRVAIAASGGVEAFLIDRSEVSIQDFEAFAGQGGYGQARLWSEEGLAWLAENPGGQGAPHRRADRNPEHPVVAVTFYEAEAFCAWRGGRLPTEEQWSLAVCGPESPRWPAEEANWYGGSKYGKVHSVATVVTGPPQGPNQLQNGSGNVWEWTTSEIGEQWKVLKGGSYANLPSYCTCSHREAREPSAAAYTTGFRCVY